MKVYIVIPCHNEEAFIGKTLASLIKQTHPASKIVVVNDNSTDQSQSIIQQYVDAHHYITLLNITSQPAHAPGSKVIAAFNKGLATLDSDYDIICKYDADLIFPEDYLEGVVVRFRESATAGIVGGFCYIEKNGAWQLENLTNKDHVRGALKAYRKACFEDIGGLKTAMGWDTADELVAQYHGWTIVTDEGLEVKHLKPTGNTYTRAARYKQGAAFYRLHYGITLTAIAAAKLAVKKKRLGYFIDCLRGYFKAKRAKTPRLLSNQEGIFVRQLRWKGIRKKLF